MIRLQYVGERIDDMATVREERPMLRSQYVETEECLEKYDQNDIGELYMESDMI